MINEAPSDRFRIHIGKCFNVDDLTAKNFTNATHRTSGMRPRCNNKHRSDFNIKIKTFKAVPNQFKRIR